MKIYSVAVMYFEGEQPVEVAESADLAPMLQLAELICQHAVAEVSSVEVWEAAWTGPIHVAFSWVSEGAIALQEEEFFSVAVR
jgi:hypothetical protein